MRKDFGPKPYLFPMPVLMIATYNEDGSVDVMNMAWGGICDTDKWRSIFLKVTRLLRILLRAGPLPYRLQM